MKPKLIENIVFSGMFQVKWPDGKLSDITNKTRAKDAIRVFEDKRAKVDARMPSNRPQMAADAFK